jgi:DNA-binding transcriptional MerR regulator
MTRGLTIGEFSRITHLSIRTLRRYHEAGLLEPAAVDPATGYRSYGLDQVPQAQVIQRFRELDMPLADIRALLATDDPARRTSLVSTHLDRLERELARTRGAVTALRRLLEPAPPPPVSLRTTPSTCVEAVRARVRHDDVVDWYADAMTSLRDVPRSGPPGGLFDHELFTDGEGEALVYVPTAAGTLTLPAREVAVVTHAGPHDDIDVSYSVLGSHVAEREIGVAGPVQEVYLVGPADDPDPDSWRTEVAWPVFRT